MESFNNLESWFTIVQESKKKEVVFYVVGNKIDLDNR
jgi:GTPase SAR1 family protein